VADLSDFDFELLTMVARVSGKSVTYTGVVNTADNPKRYMQTVDKLGEWLETGRVVPQFFVKPVVLTFNLRNPFAPFGAFKVFQRAFDKPYDEQRAIYADPEFRAILQKQIDECSPTDKGYLDRTFVWDGGSDQVQKLLKSRKTIGALAKELGQRVADCWLDIALGDDLKTEFQVMVVAYEPEGTKNLIRNGRILPGLGDAGAHMQMQNDCGYATHLLGHWCRDNQVVPVEEAVRMLTSFPADVFGIKRRGRIAKGNFADLALYDFDKVGACTPEFAHDLPGGQRRMISRATGVEATIVNGQVLFERGKHTGCLPGKMLRSGAQ
jgi:N-acyl-D-aspartate/D-glutamate deacylase